MIQGDPRVRSFQPALYAGKIKFLRRDLLMGAIDILGNAMSIVIVLITEFVRIHKLENAMNWKKLSINVLT